MPITVLGIDLLGRSSARRSVGCRAANPQPGVAVRRSIGLLLLRRGLSHKRAGAGKCLHKSRGVGAFRSC